MITPTEILRLKGLRADLIWRANDLVSKMCEAEAAGLRVEMPEFSRDELHLERIADGRNVSERVLSNISLDRFLITMKIDEDDPTEVD